MIIIFSIIKKKKNPEDKITNKSKLIPTKNENTKCEYYSFSLQICMYRLFFLT